MPFTVILALLVALAAPLCAYLVAVRQFSGKIESSDAKELWAESRSIRDWSQLRITELTKFIDRLEDRVEVLELSNDKLLVENKKLIDRNFKLLEINLELNKQINILKVELQTCMQNVDKLEKLLIIEREERQNGNA